MKAATLSPLASLILRVTGIVLVVYYLIELIVYLSTGNFQNSQWVVTVTTQLVDRGFIPLIGLACYFAGSWIESSATNSASDRSNGLKLAGLWLASILGLMFLVIVPANVTATRSAADDQVKKVEQEVTNAENQLNSQVQLQLDQQIAMVDQAIKSGQLQGDQLNQAKQQQEKLQKLKADPKALDAQIAPQRDQKLKEIRDQKNQLVDQTRRAALQSGMRVGLNGLLLAIGYATIGWVGLRQMFLR
jgi:hypothetical protein